MTYHKHSLTVKINQQEYALATNFEYRRDMSMMGGKFIVNLIESNGFIFNAFKPATEVEFLLDGRLVTKGFLDVLTIPKAGEKWVYQGADRCADLVKCSASFDGAFELKNVSLETALNRILKPFKISLNIDKSQGAIFKKVSISPSESAFAVIDRLCRYRALIPLSDGVGGLIVTKPSAVKSNGKIIVGENATRLSGQMDQSERFSTITVKGNGSANAFGADDKTGEQGVAQDPNIGRYRPLIIQAEMEGYDLDLHERAKWEAQTRMFKGTQVTYSVIGADASDGERWKINTVVYVRDPEIGIDRNMLIKGTVLKHGQNGTTTEITVARSEAFEIPAVRQRDDNNLMEGF